ncbi:protein LplB [Clostridia bacterium]|nr:protein LplB [Clostridia bacterium]
MTKKKKHKFRQDMPFYLLLLPAIVTVFVFSYMPMPGVIMAFKDLDARQGMFASPWAANGGFAHFIYVFTVPDFADAIWPTVWINILSLIVRFPAPLIFALLLNELHKKVFKRTVQTISYLPYFLSWISVTGLASSLLSEYGGINDLINAVAGHRVGFLKNPDNFIPIYLFLSVWKSIGWGSIIYLANIAAISPDLYEAATLDGANRLKRAWHVTMPALLPTAMILLILEMGQLFGSNFELVYGLQNAYFQTEVISTVIYKYGLGSGAMYEATTALNLVQSVVALTLTLGANWISKKVSKVSLW